MRGNADKKKEIFSRTERITDGRRREQGTAQTGASGVEGLTDEKKRG
jgi:hypothetical protein